MSLVRLHSVFGSTRYLNEIELINHVHAIRFQAKKLGLTGVVTYRADLFALHAEGQSVSVDDFSQFISEKYAVKYSDIAHIISRAYTGLNMSYVGNDAPIVNEPVIDWGIENPVVVFPHELIQKLLEINRLSL